MSAEFGFALFELSDSVGFLMFLALGSGLLRLEDAVDTDGGGSPMGTVMCAL